jgi:hypothetical protein
MSEFKEIGREPETKNIKNIGIEIPIDSIMDITSKEDENQIELNINNVNSSSVKLSLSVYGNNLRVKYPIKMGNVYSFLFIHGDPKMIIGPQCKHSLILVYMSIILFLIINIINGLLLLYAYQSIHSIFRDIGLLNYILQTFSQISCSITNPGIPHRNNYVSDGVMFSIYQQIKQNNCKLDKYRVCKICNILVSAQQDITHCEDCNICVESTILLILIDLDHHCVWIGKCIAKRNLRLFNVFVISTAFFGIFSIICLIAFVISYVAK